MSFIYDSRNVRVDSCGSCCHYGCGYNPPGVGAGLFFRARHFENGTPDNFEVVIPNLSERIPFPGYRNCQACQSIDGVHLLSRYGSCSGPNIVLGFACVWWKKFEINGLCLSEDWRYCTNNVCVLALGIHGYTGYFGSTFSQWMTVRFAVSIIACANIDSVLLSSPCRAINCSEICYDYEQSVPGGWFWDTRDNNFNPWGSNRFYTGSTLGTLCKNWPLNINIEGIQ